MVFASDSVLVEVYNELSALALYRNKSNSEAIILVTKENL